jgi:flagellar biosynthesis/type III secretory pathway chaperone
VTDKQLASLFQFLIDTVKDEIENHTRLLDVIHEETQALRDSRLSEILDIGICKGDAFRQAQAAAQRRVGAISKITAYLGFKDPLPFAELVAYADVATRQILTNYREIFTNIIHQIKSANETNRQTIALTLSHVANNIHYIQDITASLPNYDQHGQISAQSLQGGFISQAG